MSFKELREILYFLSIGLIFLLPIIADDSGNYFKVHKLERFNKYDEIEEKDYDEYGRSRYIASSPLMEENKEPRVITGYLYARHGESLHQLLTRRLGLSSRYIKPDLIQKIKFWNRKRIRNFSYLHDNVEVYVELPYELGKSLKFNVPKYVYKEPVGVETRKPASIDNFKVTPQKIEDEFFKPKNNFLEKQYLDHVIERVKSSDEWINHQKGDYYQH